MEKLKNLISLQSGFKFYHKCNVCVVHIRLVWLCLKVNLPKCIEQLQSMRYSVLWKQEKTHFGVVENGNSANEGKTIYEFMPHRYAHTLRHTHSTTFGFNVRQLRATLICYRDFNGYFSNNGTIISVSQQISI